MGNKRKKLKRTILVLVCILFIAFSFGFIVFSPSVELYKDYNTDLTEIEYISKTLKTYDNTGKMEFSPYNNGCYVKVNSLPSYVFEAFISVEDKRFYSHNGVDFIRIAGAFIDNIKTGKFKEGASTITQQLVKNTLLSQDKTIERKIKEIKLAQKLERQYSKKEILEKYLNVIYFGSNVYGLANASEYYFNKNATSLTVSESATLAGIINNPTLYNPYKNKENALKRRNYILKTMFDRKVITKDEYEKSVESPLNVTKAKVNSSQYYNNVISALKQHDIDITTKDKISVTLPLDRDLSNKVEKIINDRELDCNVNVIIADNFTGNVLCNVSTFKYDISSSRFMPGSTIKPVLCFAPLLEDGKIFTLSSVLDEPYSVGSYTPANFKNKYRGRITQSEALAYSSNSVALQNLEKIGINKAVDFARKTGLNFSNNDEKNYAIALGGVEYGFTLNELLTSYMTIARNGYKITPSYLLCIDNNGKSVFTSSIKTNKVMKEETAFLLSEMLKDCASYGTAKTLGKHKNVRAKTGTVGDKTGNDECYCIAFSPSYTVLCHVSKNNEKLPLSVMGGTLPTSIVYDIFETLDDKKEFEVPSGIVKKDVLISELKKGNVVLAPLYEREINKKSCAFDRDNLPTYLHNSYNDFIENYDLTYSYEFTVFNGFID